MPPTPPDVAAKMSVLFAQAPPAVRGWVDLEARKLRAIPKPDLAMVTADARQAFAARTPPLSPAQAEVLAAMALYQTAKDVESAIMTRGASKEAAGETGKDDQLVLQQLMDQKRQLEIMISNVLRASADGGRAAIAALKAS
jgi:hypothetical protein